MEIFSVAFAAYLLTYFGKIFHAFLYIFHSEKANAICNIHCSISFRCRLHFFTNEPGNQHLESALPTKIIRRHYLRIELCFTSMSYEWQRISGAFQYKNSFIKTMLFSMTNFYRQFFIFLAVLEICNVKNILKLEDINFGYFKISLGNIFVLFI